MPALRYDEFSNQRGPHRRILFGDEHAGSRFNVTCFNGTDYERSVELDLHDANGTLLGTRTMVLQPWGSDQINRVFGDGPVLNGYVDVRGGWPVICFGSLLDNQTNDPIIIPPM